MVAQILEGDFDLEGAKAWMYFDERVGFRFLDPDAPRKPWWAKGESIEYAISDVATVDEVHGEWTTGWGGTALGSTLGGFALGGWGALLGGVLGGLGFDYEIEIVFRDGKRVVVQLSGDNWERIERAIRESRREARRRAHHLARRDARRRAIESTPPPTPPRPSGGRSFDALGRPRTQ